MGRMEFSEREMEVKDTFMSMGTEIRERNTPITPKENFEAMLHNAPHWQPSIYDYMYLFPKCVPDNPPRAMSRTRSFRPPCWAEKICSV